LLPEPSSKGQKPTGDWVKAGAAADIAKTVNETMRYKGKDTDLLEVIPFSKSAVVAQRPSVLTLMKEEPFFRC
jgi:hypothetical protein